MHQVLQGIETSITPFGSYPALCTELARLSNTGRYIVVDLPSDVRNIPEIRHVSDCCIASVPSQRTSGPSSRIPPADQGAYSGARFQAASGGAQPLWWLLGCAQIGKTAAGGLERTCIASAVSLPNDGGFAVLPYEVPVMSRAEWSSLRAGVPLGSVRRAGTLLAWALLFAAGDVRKTSNTEQRHQKTNGMRKFARHRSAIQTTGGKDILPYRIRRG